ncbi:UNKNOWN [Stylonychia lemnae]|uniref:Uncharacterized protein n=1 Tax=Stylonychia lemnae TaxID=5949 RepID=A0A078AWS9_STYLE|nr:UNKNOWN [Stylonychia lemnae]|eukprot:CDW86511.1 UNKNOWN [Stylonychia lemnae]
MITANDNEISEIRLLENNEYKISKNIQQTNNGVYKIIQLNDDIFICALYGGQISLLSISNQQYSQVFQINSFKCISEICKIKNEQNKTTFAFGDGLGNGIAICQLIKISDYDYQLIQDQQRLVENGKILSIMLVNSKIIKEKGWFNVQYYDYDLNPFAFVKDYEKISLINFRNYQIIRVIDSRYIYNNKNGRLINMRIYKEGESQQIYRLFDVQRSDRSAEIREIRLRIP